MFKRILNIAFVDKARIMSTNCPTKDNPIECVNIFNIFFSFCNNTIIGNKTYTSRLLFRAYKRRREITNGLHTEQCVEIAVLDQFVVRHFERLFDLSKRHFAIN